MQPIALVTGASRGIGAAIAHGLATDGYHVLCAARDTTKLKAVASAITAAGGSAEALALDVADEQAVITAFAGLTRLDVLVNNAGIGRFAPAEQLDLADLDAILAVNLRGALACCRGAIPLMKAGGGGRIINIGSVVSVKGYPNQTAYTASKHALLGATKSMAAELQADGIRVSAVLPGGVDTDMVGDARPDLDRSSLLSADDVAEAVQYLVGLSKRCCVDLIQLRRPGAAPF
ncbi:MAG: SDR family NAD(P)-dependent oxidoreductase [Planctomycetota bacterium]|jgi:3-oxoacyl-[acyl-carrier protein] reductase|nr:SDR family NAD(P)-dependent oxidoreductase [Planctomycetota bacterium]